MAGLVPATHELGVTMAKLAAPLSFNLRAAKAMRGAVSRATPAPVILDGRDKPGHDEAAVGRRRISL
jgi:hypothetical protein